MPKHITKGIKAFSETDQTEDLKAITVPTLVTQGDDDQIVPIDDASRLFDQAAKEWHAEGLSGLSARHAHYPCRRDQSGSTHLHSSLTPEFEAVT